LVALQAQAQAGSNEHRSLVDAVMSGGEGIGFEELRLDAFRIAAGVEGWSECVSYASNEMVKQVRSYLFERQHEEEQKAQSRKRREELSRTVPQHP
jgi:hypothetical protein